MSPVRLILKQLLAGFLYYTGLLALWVFFKQTLLGKGSSIILTYHCFLDADDPLRRFIQDGLCVTPRNFEHQVLFFKRHYRPISLDALIDGLTAGKTLPRRSLVITVDDGWRDNFTNCFPVVLKYRVPVTIFVAVDFVEGSGELWFLKAARILEQGSLSASDLASAVASVSAFSKESLQKEISDSRGSVDRDRFIEQLKLLGDQDQLAALQLLESLSGVSGSERESQRNALTWEEIRQMNARGVDFGSHGNSHRILTLLSPDEVGEELRTSKGRLTERLGKETRHFAYPNGNYSATVAELVSQTGYDCGLATTHGKRPSGSDKNLYVLRRIGMHDGVSAGVSGRFSKAMLAFHLALYG